MARTKMVVRMVADQTEEMTDATIRTVESSSM